ncbi:hypothetical protein GCM10025864_34280 [Luteimicrobium album]|uniref:Dihydroorotate dehydrogenase catalytic domain-containing protein n=1 Tax=Luteimicrobium album TaxID=1054550 RepID=A0ABQ6I7C3_9MICO|nr:hypothetical protein GCM10025864_34280 [Luteimicrobium album]
MKVYGALFRGFFRHLDPERAHHLAFPVIRAVGVVPGVRTVMRRTLAPFAESTTRGPGSVQALGRSFPAPLGLAGGFDKDALAVRGLATIGFAFVEVGTVTAHAQPGNDKPRSFRVLDQRALRNRMGFNNRGAAAAAERLKRLRRTSGAGPSSSGRTSARPR